jgi:hypothetical protein
MADSHSSSLSAETVQLMVDQKLIPMSACLSDATEIMLEVLLLMFLLLLSVAATNALPLLELHLLLLVLSVLC